MIIIKKFSLKTMSVVIERNFLKKSRMTSTKQFLFDFATNRDVKNVLIMFIEIKNVNDCSIFSFSYNSNESNIIFFMNIIFENVEDEVCEFEIRFRIYIIRISSKPRASISRKNYNAQIKC